MSMAPGQSTLGDSGEVRGRYGHRRTFVEIETCGLLADIGKFTMGPQNVVADIDKRHLRLRETYDGCLPRFRGDADLTPGSHNAGHERGKRDDRIVDPGFGTRHIALQTSYGERFGIGHNFSFAGNAERFRAMLGQIVRISWKRGA
jgi:hypothetical protein